MKILVLNCGSSSLKYQVIDMNNENALAVGLCERIGIEGGRLKQENAAGEKNVIESHMNNHTDAIKLLINTLLDEKIGVLKSINEIEAVGHRVVHGGEMFTSSVIITPEVKAAINECTELAPLHNPANLIGINACEELMPNVPQVGVFDTAFHQTMSPKAFLYGIPYELYEKYQVRRYGFHGTSHYYVSQRAAEMLGKPIESLKLISCHLGNGASVCAIQGGKCVDTSMGLTPLEGLIMGTRSGDLDPAIIPFVMKKDNKTIAEMEEMLNRESGVLGISGISSDFRDVENAAEEGNYRAITALEMYHYKVAKYVGSYAAAMNGVDAVIFTAGVGENGAIDRATICGYLGFLGLTVDNEKNNVRGKKVDFATDDSKVRALLIPTNEELVIARDTKKLVK